jgi:hypothetical protein
MSQFIEGVGKDRLETMELCIVFVRRSVGGCGEDNMETIAANNK